MLIMSHLETPFWAPASLLRTPVLVDSRGHDILILVILDLIGHNVQCNMSHPFFQEHFKHVVGEMHTNTNLFSLLLKQIWLHVAVVVLACQL